MRHVRQYMPALTHPPTLQPSDRTPRSREKLVQVDGHVFQSRYTRCIMCAYTRPRAQGGRSRKKPPANPHARARTHKHARARLGAAGYTRSSAAARSGRRLKVDNEALSREETGARGRKSTAAAASTCGLFGPIRGRGLLPALYRGPISERAPLTRF